MAVFYFKVQHEVFRYSFLFKVIHVNDIVQVFCEGKEYTGTYTYADVFDWYQRDIGFSFTLKRSDANFVFSRKGENGYLSFGLHYENTTYDRVTSSGIEWFDAVPITEEEYNKEMFKSDLMALLNRYNQKDIGRKGTLTERIQRLYKRHFGSCIPPIRIGDLG